MIKLSVIIPAYNEEKRIGGTLEKIESYLQGSSLASEVEIILVDDGSVDGTVEAAKGAAGELACKVLENGTNKGKGYSVRRGMLAASGNLVLFSDADLSTPIEELRNMLPFFDKGFDVVIGSRAVEGSVLEVPQPPIRQAMGKVFNFIIRVVVLGGFSDTQCGFKCFKKEAAEKVFTLQKLNGFSFDVEALYIAKRLGLKVYEMPVRWIDSPDSRVSIIGSPFFMILELLKIRLNALRGFYRPEVKVKTAK